MLIVELEADDFDSDSDGFVKIGSLNSAIAKAKNPSISIATGLQNIERKLFAGINAAVQLGKLNPLDPQTLAPLSKSDYGIGVVPFAELVEWGQATKLFDFRRAQFTVKDIHGESTMNRAAYEEYQQALKARRAKGRYTLEEAALFIGKQTGERAEGIKNKLIAAVEKRELVTYAPGSFVKNDSKITRDFYEHVYWNDLNEWLKNNEKRLECKFPDPDAPAAKAEAVAGTSPSGDDVEAVKRGITKQQVINAFEGLHFARDKWGKYLADPPDWLMECRVTPGVQGSRKSATWNPALIAAALLDKRISTKKLDAVFVHLTDWNDEWREASAYER